MSGDAGGWDMFAAALRAAHPNLAVLRLHLEKESGYVILDTLIVHDRRQGTGTAVMTALTAEADKHGCVLALTTDTVHGASSTARLERFYRRFGFTSNRGRRRDFATRHNMTRQPLTGGQPSA